MRLLGPLMAEKSCQTMCKISEVVTTGPHTSEGGHTWRTTRNGLYVSTVDRYSKQDADDTIGEFEYLRGIPIVIERGPVANTPILSVPGPWSVGQDDFSGTLFR